MSDSAIAFLFGLIFGATLTWGMIISGLQTLPIRRSGYQPKHDNVNETPPKTGAGGPRKSRNIK